MLTYEQISYCYTVNGKYNVAISFLKKAIMLAYFLGDQNAEKRYYEKLSQAYMYTGDVIKMGFYHKRAYYGITEAKDSSLMMTVKT